MGLSSLESSVFHSSAIEIMSHMYYFTAAGFSVVRYKSSLIPITKLFVVQRRPLTAYRIFPEGLPVAIRSAF